MRSLRTAVSAGVLLLLVTACASPQAQVGAGAGDPKPEPQLSVSSPPAPTSSSPDIAPGEPPPNGGTQVPLTQVDAAALAEDYPRSVWTEGDGTVIGAIGQEGGCSKVALQVAEQSATSVHLDLVETLPAEQQMCTMDIRFPPLTAKLDAPLAQRTVVLTSRKSG
ncbi:hypothetical protein ACFFQW_27765 [Umezawaea endophytica]|uniref:Uncharacterized protein n=1 Tax=Umezawaea endophytica TaxID=1654476 RepID=A0A9X2VIB4_9PSEU|nr:hypothetical protein [Umezawaea endophytica]MCS7476634.1 hypothetical protein [Umezawaea endophytica]